MTIKAWFITYSHVRPTALHEQQKKNEVVNIITKK